MNERKNMLHGGNEAFQCRQCGAKVMAAAGSRVRNHCPQCYYSLHVDGDVPGDRASNCRNLMAPKEFFQKKGKWRVLQSCVRCGHERVNDLLLDDKNQADSMEKLLRLFKNQVYS